MKGEMEERVINQTNMHGLMGKITANRKAFLLFIAVLFASCLVVGCASLFVKYRFTGWLQLAGILFLGTVYAIVTQKKFAEQNHPGQFLNAVYFSVALLLS